jgi:hypothetical protein
VYAEWATLTSLLLFSSSLLLFFANSDLFLHLVRHRWPYDQIAQKQEHLDADFKLALMQYEGAGMARDLVQVITKLCKLPLRMLGVHSDYLLMRPR